MRPYGLLRYECGDCDVGGCRTYGRASGVYNMPGTGRDIRAYWSLRNGKLHRVRRYFKKRARRCARALLRDELRELP